MPSEDLIFLWITSALLVAMVTAAGQKGGEGPITCECTTSQCLEQDMRLCTTEGLCFTQYLDRGLDTPSLVRGCIGGRTPLLCENRKPSKAKNWPLLHCCNTNLCNHGAVPTPPSWHGDLAKGMDTFNSIDIAKGINNQSENELQHIAETATESSQSSFISPDKRSPWPHIISPVYVAVLILGIVSLIIIGIVAASVIRRNNRFYDEQYGALEFQPKTIHIHCDCDSEIESVGSSQPYLHMVCPHRNT